MTIDDLHNLAASIGTTVSEHEVGPKGFYVHQSRTISIRRGVTGPALRCTLAHELAHAMAGDEPTGIEWADARMERAADVTAARWLISAEDYAAAESLYGAHPGAIARELGVTLHVLETWQSLYERHTA